MTPIEYIGVKAGGRKDTVAGTGVVWLYPGDVQPVPDEAVDALLKHTDVWRLAASTQNQSAGLADAKPTIDLSELDDAGLKALIDERDLKVDKRKKGDALRAAVAEALGA